MISRYGVATWHLVRRRGGRRRIAPSRPTGTPSAYGLNFRYADGDPIRRRPPSGLPNFGPYADDPDIWPSAYESAVGVSSQSRSAYTCATDGSSSRRHSTKKNYPVILSCIRLSLIIYNAEEDIITIISVSSCLHQIL